MGRCVYGSLDEGAGPKGFDGGFWKRLIGAAGIVGSGRVVGFVCSDFVRNSYVRKVVINAIVK